MTCSSSDRSKVARELILGIGSHACVLAALQFTLIEPSRWGIAFSFDVIPTILSVGFSGRYFGGRETPIGRFLDMVGFKGSARGVLILSYVLLLPFLITVGHYIRSEFDLGSFDLQLLGVILHRSWMRYTTGFMYVVLWPMASSLLTRHISYAGRK